MKSSLNISSAGIIIHFSKFKHDKVIWEFANSIFRETCRERRNADILDVSSFSFLSFYLL